MQAIELVQADGAPCAAAAKKLAQHCLRNGVLILTAGTYDNVIRLLMPLTISDDDFSDALDVIESGLSAAAAELEEAVATAH
jgi:4-aminobutyrate aminotransferase/(S)-3-amino-2-methylpropionate transaminase